MKRYFRLITTASALVVAACVAVSAPAHGAIPSNTLAGASLHASVAGRAAIDGLGRGHSGDVPSNRVASLAGVNPENPRCGKGTPTTYSGGTGWFYANSFISDYVAAPSTGVDDVPDGNFTNIFLYPDSSKLTWDQYMATLPASERGPSQAQLDAMTVALVCSSYFDDLSQYNINPPIYSGDEQTIASCVAPALADAKSKYSGVISYATMRTFAGCEQSNGGINSPQVNIFTPFGIKASSYGNDGTDLCSTSTIAYHGAGLNVPNWTVVPTNPKCNSDPAHVMDALSHEMVETVSDPFGFGWMHREGDFNFWQNGSEGELADICSGVGQFPTPSSSPGFVPFPATPALTKLGLSNLFVAPYYSDQDSQCEPTAVTNDTLVPLAGSPSIRFTGSVHDLVIPVHQSSPPPGLLDQLELDIATGGDNLDGSSSANLLIEADIGGQTVQLQQDDINQGAEWTNYSMHAVYVELPQGLTVSDILQITLDTQFGGGTSGDNWDVTGVVLQAAVYPNTGDCPVTVAPPLINVTGSTVFDDGSTGLARLKGGGVAELPQSLAAVPSSEQDQQVTALDLIVTTGDDNLRGGNQPQDNANAIVQLSGGRAVTFSDINQDNQWPNYTSSPMIFLLQLNSLPPDTAAKDLERFVIETDLPGGLSGDNWDILGLQLFATLGCKATPPPKTVTRTLVNDIGLSALTDGSIGLCRLTGSANNCLVTVPAPKGLAASDPVDSAQLSITTGNDDLRGGSFPGDNANVSIGGQTFRDVNNMYDWTNGAPNTVPLVITGAMTLGAITSIKITTGFGGGVGGDNWDIAEVELAVMVTVPKPALHTHALRLTASRAARSGPLLVEAPLTSRAHDAPASLLTRESPRLPELPMPSPSPSPWHVAPSADHGRGDNVLNGIGCASLGHCFAVGYFTGKGGAHEALIEAGSGAHWSAVASPKTGTQYSVLNSVSCSAPNECIAVGFDGSGSVEGAASIAQTLIETWNGTSWSVTESGNPPGQLSSQLESISCLQTEFYCIAVGYEQPSSVAQTLIERFINGVWFVMPSANPPRGDSLLYGISCPSTTSCTAVGGNDSSGELQTLAESWDGSTWSLQTTQDEGKPTNVLDAMGLNVLYAVSCYSPTACTAVGAYIGDDRRPHALIEQRVAGQSWTIAPSNNSSSGQILYGVSCDVVPMCAAVGFSENGIVASTLDDNWAGGPWAQTPSPSPGKVSNFLTSDWCDATAGCVAAGDDGPGHGINATLALDFAPTPPAAPTGVTGIAGKATGAVTFLPPADNGGFPVTSYTVHALDITDAAHGGQSAKGTASPITVSGLTSGDAYRFVVIATDLAGAGPVSAPSAPVVVGGAPTVTSVKPKLMGQGASAVLTIFGTGFATGTTASVADPGVTLSGFSVTGNTVMKANVSVAATAATGTFAVTVTNGSGSASCNCFTVVAHPTFSAALPAQIAVGASGKVIFSGTDLRPGATLQFSGPAGAITATHVVARNTKLAALLTVSATAPVGPYTVTVKNTLGAEGTCVTCLTVIAAPTLTSLSPATAATGTTTSVTITGTGFAPGVKVTGPVGVTFSGITVDSATSITATMTVTASAETGTSLAITVLNNPAGGRGGATSDLLSIT